MAKELHPAWIKDLKLSREEIATVEQYMNLIEKADKNKLDFLTGATEFTFTPVAMLVLAVVHFVYEVYRDYGSSAFTTREFPVVFKDVVQRLRELESISVDNPSIDIYAKLRRELADARSSSLRAQE